MFKSSIFPCAIAAAATAAIPALARDVIVVTATRSETNAERLAASVEVIDAGDIVLLGYQTLADALAASPGVQATPSGPAGSFTSVFVRGADSDHTLALYDGVRLNDPSAANGIFDFGQETLGGLDRVEVLRGPASVIYGSDAIGGVVNLIPVVGGEQPITAQAEASYGDFATLSAALGVRGRVRRLAYAVSAERFQTDGFNATPARFAASGSEHDGAEMTTLTALAHLEMNAALRLEGLVRRRDGSSQFDTFSGGASGFARADDPDLEVSQDDLTVWRLGARYAPGTAFESRLRAGQVLRAREERDGGVLTAASEGERTFAEWLSVWRPAFAGVEDAVITAGVQWENDSLDAPVSFNAPLRADEDQAGIFVVGQASVPGALSATASLRADSFESFGAHVTAHVGGVFAPSYLPIDIIASYATSFNAPTLTERFGVNAFNIGNPGLEPEDGESWEIGLRTTHELAGRPDAISGALTYYQTEITNLIEYNFAALRNENVGRADIQGVEASVELAPADWITGRLTYAFTDAFNGSTGDALLRRPRHNWTGRVTMRPNDRARLALQWRRVGERPDVNYADSGDFTGVGGTLGAFNVVDVSGEWRLTDALAVSLRVANLFDEAHEQPEAFRGAPRAATVSLRAQF